MILSVDGICFSYNSHPVLDTVSCSVEKGRMLAVLGVNGAGKSTLLKCFNRIIRPRSGSVFLGEEDLFKMPRDAVARRMGYVPQQHAKARLSVYEAVLLGRRPHMGLAMGKADYAVVEDTLERMGLSGLSLRSLCDLSGGEVQKVMIARALAQSPAILLLDEPTSNLDLKNQMDVMDLIRTVVVENGLMAVVAIHDLNLAVRFSDQFLFLKDHRVHAMVDREDLDAGVIEQVYGLKVQVAEVAGHRVVVPL